MKQKLCVEDVERKEPVVSDETSSLKGSSIVAFYCQRTYKISALTCFLPTGTMSRHSPYPTPEKSILAHTSTRTHVSPEVAFPKCQRTYSVTQKLFFLFFAFLFLLFFFWRLELVSSRTSAIFRQVYCTTHWRKIYYRTIEQVLNGDRTCIRQKGRFPSVVLQRRQGRN